MEFANWLFLILAAAVGGAVVYLVLHGRVTAVENTVTNMKESFRALSAESLKENSAFLLEQAKRELSGQVIRSEGSLEMTRDRIGESLTSMGATLDRLRQESATLSARLNQSREETDRLRRTTDNLTKILAHPQTRGHWGEKMVEDILQQLGMVKGINYWTQKRLTNSDKTPDFTFPLPKGLMVHLDVKFPHTHFSNYVAADSDAQREEEKRLFLRDVIGHIKAVGGREGYVDPAAGTVDYALMLIPNESIYYFLFQEPREMDLVQEALNRKVVLCSPITLYAVLSLIRQAATNFAIEQNAEAVQRQMVAFWDQWKKFVEQMGKVGERIDAAKREFESLRTTRVNALDRPLEKLRQLELGTAPPAQALEIEQGEGEDRERLL